MTADTVSRVAPVRLSLGMVALTVSLAACSGPANPAAPDAAVAPGASTAGPGISTEIASATAFCVDEINRLRATVGAAPLARSGGIDAFSNDAARADTEVREAHHYFKITNGGNGTATAETMIPWWPLSRYGAMRTVVKEGLAMMWAQGPGGSHYDIIRGNFQQVGCGVFVSAIGEVTVAQDYH